MSSSCFDMTSDKGGGRHGHHDCVRSVLGSLLYIPSDDILTTTTTTTGGDDDDDDGDGAMGYDDDGVGATGDKVGDDDGDGTMSDNDDGDGATGNEVDDDGNDDDYGNGRRQRWRRRDGQHIDGDDTMATARRATKSTMMATAR
jgi:hypothetical protein